MKLLIISEGKHELHGALATLVLRLTGIEFDFNLLKVSDPVLRVHAGKGPGYFKKAVRCLIYAQQHGYDGVVLLIDQDDRPERRRQLTDAQDELRLGTIPRALGVAVITFDAWMLADEQALAAVLKYQVGRQPDPETIIDAKAACSALRDSANSPLSLAELYAEVSGAIDLAVLTRRCPLGFEPFAQRTRAMAERLSR